MLRCASLENLNKFCKNLPMQRPVPKAYILVSNEPAQIQRQGAQAAKTLSSILRTCLGPRAMQKMVLTKIGSIELTNDGNAILREMDVGHPAARCLIELCQTQDDECGDGTTSTLLLSAELLSQTVPLLKKHHPIRVCSILRDAMNISLSHLQSVSMTVAEDQLLPIVASSVSTKLCTVLRVPIPELALNAAQAVRSEDGKSVDIKTDIKVVKVLGDLFESEVLDGIIFEKDLIHSQMRRRVENPKILLIDSPLEYKKGESVTNFEFSGENDMKRALELEEAQVRGYCEKIISVSPDIVITEKGISDLALGILYQNNITAFRRVKRSDMIRLSKATGATIMNRIEDIEERHLGSAGLFEYVKINTDYYCKIAKCRAPKAVSVLLRGPSSDLINELERNFMDAVKVARNVMRNPLLVPGGGATEMGIAVALKKAAMSSSDELRRTTLMACYEAFKVIPSALAVNSGCGVPLDLVYQLEKRATDDPYCGVDGESGEVCDMRNGIREPIVVKEQCVKSSFEAVMQLLRVDGIIESRARS